MPTEPLPDVLRRKIQDPSLRKKLARLSAAIDEAVNFGTQVMGWSVQANRGEDEAFFLIFSLRHGLGILDSISIMLRNSCVEPCALLLRGLVEILFTARYMMDSDTWRKGMCFVVWYAHERLNLYERLDPTRDRGKQLQAELRKDRLVASMAVPSTEKLAEMRRVPETHLKDPKYREVEAEYQKLRESERGNPNWYSLFGGPKNIQQLAEESRVPSVYGVLYRALSGFTHGTDIIAGRALPGQSGGTDIASLRHPLDAEHLAENALSIAVELYRTFIRHYVPAREGDLDTWRVEEIANAYPGLSGKMITVTL